MTNTTRDAFEAWADNARPHQRLRSSTTDNYDYPLGKILFECWQAATEQDKPQWLPIADAPVYEDVLIWPRLERTVIAHKNTVGKWEYDEYQAGFGWDNVYLESPPTHWMPLPLPPTATPQGKI